MYSGLMYTETMMKQYYACIDKIIGDEQGGMYSSPKQLKWQCHIATSSR